MDSGQNLKLLYLDKDTTGQVSETVAVGPKGRLLLSGFDASAHRVCMTNVGPVQGALLFSSQNNLRIFLKKELMRSSLFLVLMT